MYDISKEKGKAIERNEDISITYWDLQNSSNQGTKTNFATEKCSYCNGNLKRKFKYCPHFGKELK
ncbi:hypothetical protein G9F69_008755 [Clostridium sp. M14]|nr:hypothetical protein [Clostridium sp. M14]